MGYLSDTFTCIKVGGELLLIGVAYLLHYELNKSSKNQAENSFLPDTSDLR